jgi:hypothetical protein
VDDQLPDPEEKILKVFSDNVLVVPPKLKKLGLSS